MHRSSSLEDGSSVRAPEAKASRDTYRLLYTLSSRCLRARKSEARQCFSRRTLTILRFDCLQPRREGLVCGSTCILSPDKFVIVLGNILDGRSHEIVWSEHNDSWILLHAQSARRTRCDVQRRTKRCEVVLQKLVIYVHRSPNVREEQQDFLVRSRRRICGGFGDVGIEPPKGFNASLWGASVLEASPTARAWRTCDCCRHGGT